MRDAAERIAFARAHCSDELKRRRAKGIIEYMPDYVTAEVFDELLKQWDAAQREANEHKRKGERRGQEIVRLLDKLASQRHEIRSLERLLVWVARTGAHDFRDVIRRRIPRAFQRQEAAQLPGGTILFMDVDGSVLGVIVNVDQALTADQRTRAEDFIRAMAHREFA